MTGEEFVKLCFDEKEAILRDYFSANSHTEAASRIRALIRSGTNPDALYDLIRLVLTENYYTLLLALDGEATLGGRQICYQLFDENNNRLNACGEIEEAAFRYFMEE